MQVSHKRATVAQRIGPAAARIAFAQMGHEALNPRIPLSLVPEVCAVRLPARRTLESVMGQQKLAQVMVECEARNGAAPRVDKDGARSVENIPRRSQRSALTKLGFDARTAT